MQQLDRKCRDQSPPPTKKHSALPSLLPPPLICLFVSLPLFLTVSSSLSLAPPPSAPYSILSLLGEFLSLSSGTPDKTDESGMFPHCGDGWQPSSMGFCVCVCVCVCVCLCVYDIFFPSSAFQCFLSMLTPMHTQNLHSVSPPLFLPLFRDVQSSASKLGYSMPLPNCPTAWGSDRSGYAERGLQSAFKIPQSNPGDIICVNKQLGFPSFLQRI